MDLYIAMIAATGKTGRESEKAIAASTQKLSPIAMNSAQHNVNTLMQRNRSATSIPFNSK